MAWIESHSTLRTHKKLKAFCDDLKISRAAGIGHLHMLWWWALDNRENGDLSDLFERDIAIACDWDGNPKALLKTLKKHNWITKEGKINAWMEYAGRLIKERERGRERRKSKYSSKDESADASRDESKDESTDNHGTDPRLPNQTKPNQTVRDNENHDFFSNFTKKDQETIEKKLKEVRGYAKESTAMGVAVLEFKEIIRKKQPDNPVGYVIKILKNELEAKTRSN